MTGRVIVTAVAMILGVAMGHYGVNLSKRLGACQAEMEWHHGEAQ